MLSDELFVIVQSVIISVLDLKAWEIIVMCISMRIILTLCGIGTPKIFHSMMSWVNYLLFGKSTTPVEKPQPQPIQKPKFSYPLPSVAQYPQKFNGAVNVGPQQSPQQRK